MLRATEHVLASICFQALRNGWCPSWHCKGIRMKCNGKKPAHPGCIKGFSLPKFPVRHACAWFLYGTLLTASVSGAGSW